MPQERHQR